MSVYRSILSFILLLFVTQCIEPYQAPEIKTNLGLLVVDGLINVGDRAVSLKLSRTLQLTSQQAPTPETHAIVKLEEEGNPIFTTVPEIQTGTYYVSGLNLNMTKQYKLHIQTSLGKSYASDDIQLKQSPPIDSVYWEADRDGVHLYVDTHDPSGNSGYYMWTYVETWQHDAFYDPRFKIANGAIVDRPLDEKTNHCWSTDSSTNILLSSSKKLSQDIISKFSITEIRPGSPKTSVKYSILLTQQVLTEDAFNYWQQLQKTTEKVGGLFDPLPSQVTGNMYNINDPREQVLGYFTGGTITEQRIFIDGYDLPSYLWIPPITAKDCPFDTIWGPLEDYNGLLVQYKKLPPLYVLGHCTDCRADGGTLIKPSFWP